jgi:hypothetical protein
MSKPSTQIGDRYGRLVVERIEGKKAFSVCDCGSRRWFALMNLRSGHTLSCGCLQRERAVSANTKHGLYGTPEYGVWNRMRHRCNGGVSKDVRLYQDRGITVCNRWNDFGNFLKDMGPRPSTKHSIDRIDNDKGYFPKNCRWATASEQARNTRQTTMLTIDGVTKSLGEWCDEYKIAPGTVHRRLRVMKWSHKDSVFTPLLVRYSKHDS